MIPNLLKTSKYEISWFLTMPSPSLPIVINNESAPIPQKKLSDLVMYSIMLITCPTRIENPSSTSNVVFV